MVIWKMEESDSTDTHLTNMTKGRGREHPLSVHTPLHSGHDDGIVDALGNNWHNPMEIYIFIYS